MINMRRVKAVFLLGLLALFVCSARIAAQDATAAKLPADLALVPPDAAGVLHVRVADVLQSELGKVIRKLAPKELLAEINEGAGSLGAELTEIERLTIVAIPHRSAWEVFEQRRDQGGLGMVVVVSTLKPYDRKKLTSTVLHDATEEKYRGRTILRGGAEAIYPVTDRVYAIAHDMNLLRPVIRHSIRSRGPGPLSHALAATAGKHPLVAGLNPAAVIETFGTRALGDWPFSPIGPASLSRLLEAESATLIVNSSENKLQASLEADFGTEFMARRALPAGRTIWQAVQDVVAEAVDDLAEEPQAEILARLLGHVENSMADSRIAQQGTSLRLAVSLDARPENVQALLTQGAAQAIAARGRVESSNNLKQIAIALHNLHDVEHRFGHYITDPGGKPLLSWRVAILPYLEEVELYKQFRLDEAWDSPHSKKLIEKMPKVYAPIGVKTKTPHTTFYQGFSGPNTVFGNPRGVSIGHIHDGTSNTFMVVEAGEGVVWTRPQDIPYDPKKPLPKLGGLFSDGFHAALCDASVQFIRRDADEEMLRRAIIINDGFVVDFEKLTGRRPSRSRFDAQPGSAVKTVPAAKADVSPVPPKQ
jgi:hypothetical protein